MGFVIKQPLCVGDVYVFLKPQCLPPLLPFQRSKKRRITNPYSNLPCARMEPAETFCCSCGNLGPCHMMGFNHILVCAVQSTQHVLTAFALICFKQKRLSYLALLIPLDLLGALVAVDPGILLEQTGASCDTVWLCPCSQSIPVLLSRCLLFLTKIAHPIVWG